MIPVTKITTASGYITSDCMSEEFSRRRIYITSEITADLAAEVCCQINHLAASNSDDITLWIQSPGGSVSAGFAILDTCMCCGCDIRTIVMGQAASMAAVLASSGTKGKRFIGANAEMMLHQALGGVSGQTTDILRKAKARRSTKLPLIIHSDRGSQYVSQAYCLVFEYIEAFYNTKRIHSHCDFMSPNDFELLYEQTQTNKLLLVS